MAITRPAPKTRPSWTASDPTPPAALWTTTLSPGATRAAVRYRCQAVVPCRIIASALPSSSPSGTANTRSSGADGVLGVAAVADQRHDPLAGVLAHPRHLSAGDQRQARLLDVGVRAGVGVGEVQARPADADQHLLGTGLGHGQLGQLQHLGPPELGHLDRSHLEIQASGVAHGRLRGVRRLL